MDVRNPSPDLYNEDLAPAKERNWGAFSIFNVWTSDVHSLWGYYLAASLFLLCGSFLNFIIAIGLGSLIIFVLMNLIGYAGEKTGVPYPVLARASFGVWGANLAAMVRAVVACFWYGAQTAAASGAMVALLIRSDGMLEFHKTTHVLGHSGLEVICYVIIWALQLLIIQRGMETVRKFQDWAGPAVWVAMLVLAIGLCVKAGGFSFDHGIPMDVLLEKTKDAGVSGEPGSFWALMAVGATWVTYFAALYLNFCDFSRYAKNKQAVKTGNLWGLPVNLIAFSLVAGVTTIAAFKVYGEVLLHPEQISAKFDSWVLALIAAVSFAAATLGINVVANFVSAAFDISNVFPRSISFKKGGYIAAGIALVLYPFAPWEGNAAHFVNAIGATMGPLLGIILVDYYLVAKGNINVEALYHEHGEYRYQGGWNMNALAAAGVGAVFSTVLPNFTNLLPTWWGIYGWFFGVAIAGSVYLVLAKLRPRPVPMAGARPEPGHGATAGAVRGENQRLHFQRRTAMLSKSGIAERVVQSILSRKLRPGERLGEQDLASLFGVSRTLVREALMQLQARGFVEVRSRLGWYVVEPSFEEARETYAARRVIEPGMLRDAGKPLQTVIRTLRKHVADERKAVASGDAAQRAVLLADFHVCLAECLGNRFLTGVMVDLSARTTLVSAMYQSQAAAQESNADHADIVDALAAGDSLRAETLMRAHIDALAARLDENLANTGTTRSRLHDALVTATAPRPRAKVA